MVSVQATQGEIPAHATPLPRGDDESHFAPPSYFYESQCPIVSSVTKTVITNNENARDVRHEAAVKGSREVVP